MEIPETNTTRLIFNRSDKFNSTDVTENFASHSMGYFVFVSIICAVGISGNMLVLLSIIKEKKLRTVANYMIGHLSLVDLLTCCVILPIDLANKAGVISAVICRMIANTFALLPNLSIHTQCLISINRYALVTKPIDVYRTWFSKIRTCCAILTIWILNTIVLLVVDLFLSKPMEDDLDICNTSDDPSGARVINNYILSLSGILMFTISFIFYGKLILFVRRNPISLTSIKRADSKASMTLLCLLIIFGISLIISPLFLYLNKTFVLDSKGVLNEMTICVILANYCINPIFYGLKIRLFQQTYARLLCFFAREQRIAPAQSSQPNRLTDNVRNRPTDQSTRSTNV